MIITKDMLASKGVAKDIVDDFTQEFPNGFDFHKKQFEPLSISSTELADLFSYTGIFTCEFVSLAGFTTQFNYISGVLENLPNGNPAKVTFDSITNTVFSVQFYSGGVEHNPKKLFPARITWDGNGKIVTRSFYENGDMNDPFPNVPAFAAYRHAGRKVSMIVHYYNDVIHDPPNNTAAWIEYRDDGTIAVEDHYRYGVRI